MRKNSQRTLSNFPIATPPKSFPKVFQKFTKIWKEEELSTLSNFPIAGKTRDSIKVTRKQSYQEETYRKG